MARYRLLRGNHTRREGGDRKHKTYSAGDEIELTDREARVLGGRVRRVGTQTLTATPPAPGDDGGDDNFVTEEDIARERELQGGRASQEVIQDRVRDLLDGKSNSAGTLVGTDDGAVRIPSGDEVDAKEREAAAALAAASGGEGDKAADVKPAAAASPLADALAKNSQARANNDTRKHQQNPKKRR
jgi:hypothetical protein